MVRWWPPLISRPLSLPRPGSRPPLSVCSSQSLQVCRLTCPQCSLSLKKGNGREQNSREHWSQNQARGPRTRLSFPTPHEPPPPAEPLLRCDLSRSSSLLRRNCSEFFLKVGPSPPFPSPALSLGEAAPSHLSGVAVTPACPVLPVMMGMATLSPALRDVRTLEGPPIAVGGGGVPSLPPPGPDSGLLSRCVS